MRDPAFPASWWVGPHHHAHISSWPWAVLLPAGQCPDRLEARSFRVCHGVRAASAQLTYGRRFDPRHGWGKARNKDERPNLDSWNSRTSSNSYRSLHRRSFPDRGRRDPADDHGHHDVQSGSRRCPKWSRRTPVAAQRGNPLPATATSATGVPGQKENLNPSAQHPLRAVHATSFQTQGPRTP